MKQLEMRFYGRAEIAEITNISIAAHNFSRDVKDTLAKWGYGYDWINRRGVTITYVPATPEERLKEILIRQFHIDVQVDMYDFACFVTAFSDIDGFDSMPWDERETAFKLYLGKKVDKKTLSKWSRTLIEQEIMGKDCVGRYWKTEIVDNKKIRSTVSKEEVETYENRRKELLTNLEEFAINAMHQDPKISYREAIKEAWKEVYYILWDEFECCYYSCKVFRFTAWNDQGDLAEVYELIREISGKEGKHA